MPLLALDAALEVASAAIVDRGRVLALEKDPVGVARLAVLAERVLGAAGIAGADLEAVAASVGPGSFTGIRTALALATGIGLATGKPVIGVSVGEALAAILPIPSSRALWVAIDSKRGRIFLERAGALAVFDRDRLPFPSQPVLLGGDAAGPVAEQLSRLGADVALAEVTLPDAAALGLAGETCLASLVAPRSALPLYVDPPAARLPTGHRPDMTPRHP